MLLSYDSEDILLGSSRVETRVIHILYPLDMLPPTEGRCPLPEWQLTPFQHFELCKRCICFLSLYLQWFSYCSNPTKEKKCTSMHKGHWNQHNKINKKIWAIECDRHKGQIPGLLQPTFCVTASPNLSFLICTTGMILLLSQSDEEWKSPACKMSDTEPGEYLLNILSVLQVLSDRLLITTLWDRYYHYPHFTDEGSEAQRS